jgi:hypothetical protein
MTLPEIRNQLMLYIIALYLILNYGFMLVRVPIGIVEVPVGELLIVFFLFTIHYPTTLPCFKSVFPLALLLCWWGYVLTRAFSGVPEYGLWALRDATNVIESLYFIGGFVFAQRPANIEKFFIWLPKLLIAACCYGLTYPLGVYIRAISPTITGGTEQIVTLIGTYTNSSVIMLWSAFSVFIYLAQARGRTAPGYLFSIFLIGFSVIIFQARTIYLQIMAIFLLFLLFRKDLITKGVATIILCLFIISLFPMLDVKITGRLGEEVSVGFINKHFMAIFGVSNKGVEHAAQGVFQRTGWWASIYNRLTNSFLDLLIGLGYGFPLIDFHVTGGVPVREPHNSYISIVARSGLIGLMFFFSVHFFLLRIWYSTYNHCKRLLWDQGANNLLILMIYFVLIWIFAIGEDAFEKPFNTIPYYFSWGIILRFAYHLKLGNIGPGGFPNQNLVCS